MTVGELVSSIADAGILVCIAALFLYACFRAIKSFFDKKDKAATDTKELALIPSKPQRDAHDKALDIRLNMGTKIQELIENYRPKFECDRILVVEFGNSQISLGYLPFRYMTCTYETCRLGVRGVGHKIDKISTSLFTHFFIKLQECGWCEYDLREHPEEIPGAMRDWMEEYQEPRSLNAAIISPAGKFIGYVSVKNKQQHTEDDIDNILTLADQLAALLGILDQRNTP